MLPPPPHEQLKGIRDRLGITTRDVAEFSHKIAEAEGNPEYQISNAWLTQVENSDSVPSIYKLYSLSSIYRIKFTDLLRIYGVDLQNLNRHQLAEPLPNTHLTTLEVYDAERTVTFPVRFDRSFDIDNTTLVSRIVELWGEVPIALIQHLDIRHSQYGYVGLQDFTLYPLLRPGSFVQIDSRVRKYNRSDGARSSTGRFTSSNCATGMRVRGANCRRGTCCSCRIRCRRAACGG